MENLLLPKDLLELWKTRFLSTGQLFQRMFDDIVEIYNNTVHRTIKMKQTDVTFLCWIQWRF